MKLLQSIRDVEQREWQLWAMAIALIFILGSITASTYFFILSDVYQSSIFSRSMANRALGGVYLLILLFCAYVIHTRVVFGKMKTLLERQATRDALTDLYNRSYLKDRLEEEIARADKEKSILALLLCDLDHFATINESWGYKTGDEVLKAVARSIHESCRGTDLVSRWGGDEIVVVLTNTTREGVIIAAERIRNGVCRVGDKSLFKLDIGIGIALYPDHGKNADELLRTADRALYFAKKGGGKIHFGDEEYRIDENSIKIVFQPVVDIRNRHILGYESLGRDPRGKVSILDLFKRYQIVGQLNELKCLYFKIQIDAAKQVGLQKMFLNVDFNMLKKLESVPIPPDMEVILEISELEALHDVEGYLKIAQKWRAEGYKFAIDDFGAGFISLPFIAELVPDYIKIDRKTILQAVSSKQFKLFLKDLVYALQNYAVEGIIAEGIETETELQVVKDLGINLVQGFLLGRPHELI